MFLSRVLARRLFTAAKSEASASAAPAVSSAKTTYNPLEEFFEADRSADDDKPVVYGIDSVYSLYCTLFWEQLHIYEKYKLYVKVNLSCELGVDEPPDAQCRSWKASELRLKSWDDLHKLWYVLLKEKNMLMTQRQMLHAQNLRFSNPERIPKVRKSMCRLKHVLTERAIAEPDPRRSAEMKRMINAL
ncbi:hypothetical protein ACLOJK_026160 [Asimina triloba]